MSIRKVFMTLDVRKAESQTTIEGLHVGDIGSTQLVVTLNDGTRAIDLTKYGTVTAIIHGKKPDGHEIHNQCDVTGGKIYYTLTAQDTAAVGTVDYQLDVQISEEERCFSPRFRSRVSGRVYEPVFRLLDSEPEDWAQNYAKYYKKVDDVYVKNNDPTYAADTFYVLVDPPVESASEFLAFWSALHKVEELFDQRLIIDTETTDIGYDADNIHKVFINAIVEGEKGIVFTLKDNTQFFIGRNGNIKKRIYTNQYENWTLFIERTSNKVISINNSNKYSTDLYPSLKAVADYIANEIAAKADKATTLAGYGITDAYTKLQVDEALEGKAAANHTHDMSAYATNESVTAALAGKADVNHTHDMSAYATNDSVTAALAGKSDIDHTHDMSAYALAASVAAALALKADSADTVRFKPITGADITYVADEQIDDEKTIYRIYISSADKWGLMVNIITHQLHTQIIFREDGHVLYRQKILNASWNKKAFTDVLGGYVTTSSLEAGLAGKADSDHTHSQYLTEHQDISGKADKATTLSGYGITNAYTKSEADNKFLTSGQILSDYYTKYEIDNTFLDIDQFNSELDTYDGYLSNKENLSNKQIEITAQNKSGAYSGEYYPSVKAVADYVDSELSGKADKSDTYTKEQTQTTIDDSIISKLRINNSGKMVYTDDDIPYVLGDISGKADKSTTLAGYGITNAYTKTEIDNKGYLTAHQDISGKENSANKVTSVSDQSTDEQYPSAKAVYDAVSVKVNAADVNASLEAKADKVPGKGLSTNDYTTAEKNKLAGIEAGANKFPSGGSVGQVLMKSASAPEWKDIPKEYEFVNEIPQNADHSQKYVLPDGYIYEWQEAGETIEYDANRTDYTGDEAWKNRVLNQKPDLANSTNIKVLTNEPGVLMSAVIPYGPDWGWNGDDDTINTNTNKTKVEIKGGFGAKLSAMVRPVGSGIGDKAFVIYYYDENGTYLGNLSPKDSQIIRWNSEWVAQNAYYETDVDYDMPVCFKCMDSSLALGAAKYSQVRYVRIALGVCETGDITESDVSDIKIHVPYYDVPSTVGGWTKTEERHPFYIILDDAFKVSTAQKLYAVGDSITWGYKNTGSGIVQIDSWVKHLIDINGYAPVSSSGSKNLGISGIGFCVPTLNFGVNPIYLEDSDIWKADYSDADIITVALGINDWRDTTGVATYENMRTKMFNFFARLRNGDINTNPDYKGNQVCKIYFILPFNERTKGTVASDFYSLGWKNINYPTYCCGKTLMEFVNFIKDTVNSGDFKQFRIQLIDMTECPAINRHNMPTALLDGLHPSEETHAVLGKEIARILAESHIVNSDPTKTSQFTNDSGFLTLATLPTYNGGVQ